MIYIRLFDHNSFVVLPPRGRRNRRNQTSRMQARTWKESFRQPSRSIQSMRRIPLFPWNPCDLVRLRSDRRGGHLAATLRTTDHNSKDKHNLKVEMCRSNFNSLHFMPRLLAYTSAEALETWCFHIASLHNSQRTAQLSLVQYK